MSDIELKNGIANDEAEVVPPAQPMNGNAAQIAQQQALQQIDAVLFPAINIMTMGARVSMMAIPPDVVLYAMCRNLGRVIGMQFANADNIGVTLKARKIAVEEFERAVRSIKPQPQQPKPQPMMTASPQRQ